MNKYSLIICFNLQNCVISRYLQSNYYSKMNRVSNANDSSDDWSTQSNMSCSSTKKRKVISNGWEAALELRLWKMLGEFNPDATIQAAQKTAKKLMKLIKTYCPIKSRVSKRSKKRFSAKPTTAPEQRVAADAPQSPDFMDALVDTELSDIDPLTDSVPSTSPQRSASPQPSTSTGTFTTSGRGLSAKPSSSPAKKLKPSSSLAKAGNAVRPVRDQKPTKMERELKRLATSDDFVARYVSAYKRVSKPIERYAVVQFEEEKLRRSSRATSRGNSRATSRGTSRGTSRATSHATSRASSRATSHGTSRESNRRYSNESETDEADQQPNATDGSAEATVHSVQQTVSQTSSKIGSYHMNEWNFFNRIERISNGKSHLFLIFSCAKF